MNENKKLIIGIPGWKVGDNSYGCGVNHLEYANSYGNVKIIMPWQELDKEIDMLYIPGGMDLNPASYGEIPSFKTSNQDVFKQFFFDKRLKGYIEAKIPILAICLGFQEIAAIFGLKLEQDLMYHPQSKDRWEKGHEVFPIDLQGNIFKGKKYSFEVNSHHHQGVMLKQFDNNKELIPLLVAEDGVVEAFMHKSLPILAVQFHPEEWLDNDCGFVKNHIKKMLDIKETVLS